jgi:hypothetical protein
VSNGDFVGGDFSIDRGPWSITGDMSAQDPLAVPLVAALSGTQLVQGVGRMKAGVSFTAIGIAHALVNSLGMDIADNAAGNATFGFKNRANASTTLALEAPTALVSAPTVANTRATTIKILSAVFTPVGGNAITVPGVTRFSFKADAIEMGDAMAPGSEFEDATDFGGWRISGSIDHKDFEIGSSVSMSEALAGALRGTLVLTCRVSGQDEAATPPANVVLTFNHLKFHDLSESFATKGDGSASIQFDQLLRTGATPLPLSSMITAA